MTLIAKKHRCGLCSRRFRTEDALEQHWHAVHCAVPLARMDPDDIYEFVEAMDLPDGAHWAMIEELSGLEPGDFAQ